ncbi:TadE family protein [Bradyrhizobium tunisiense]|uniref:TadE family protein n=1 Tax=Bradyrhizobium tunisiense TaxID=3278709 RepID=UPI0035D6B73E
MRKLDNRGVAAFEFCVVAGVFFMLVFAIVDFGRYAITMQSLRHLAGAGARAMMIQCYTPAVISNNSPSGCTGDYLTSTEKQNTAPFLYAGGLSPTLATTSGGGMLTVTASQPDFAMLVPIWGSSLNAPSASTQVPFSP